MTSPSSPPPAPSRGTPVPVLARKVIVERDSAGFFLVMFDTGRVHGCADKFQVVRLISRRDRLDGKRRKAIIVSEVEWRGMPPSFTMPTSEEWAVYGGAR